MWPINFGFVITALSFLIRPHLRPFWNFLGPLRLFLGLGAIFLLGVRFNKFLRSIRLLILVWNYSPIFFLNSALFGAFLDLFVSFGAIFWGWGHVQKVFLNLLTQTINSYF